MSAHTHLTLEHFRHVLLLAVNAHVNDNVILRWMIMEPKVGEIGYAASIGWPMTTSKATQDALGQATLEANTHLQKNGYHIPDDLDQKMSGQALEILPKTNHEILAARAAWTKKQETT